ncbi:hypothetical protein LCGC14_1879520, partial [marine sediment metagenome]
MFLSRKKVEEISHQDKRNLEIFILQTVGKAMDNETNGSVDTYAYSGNIKLTGLLGKANSSDVESKLFALMEYLGLKIVNPDLLPVKYIV